MPTVNLILNNKPVSAEAGSTILQVAQREGIHIPTLCHHPALAPEGSCRLCVVEDVKSKKLIPACITEITNGMQIETANAHVRAEQRFVLELLLSEHPLDCMTCEKNGACQLQDLAYEFKIDTQRWGYSPRPGKRDLSHPFIAFNPQKCVLCRRCVRGCAEIQGRFAIDVCERGSEARIAPDSDCAWIESTCEACGTCIALCPTDALSEKTAIGTGRTWEMHKVSTICPYCGVGCTIDLNIKQGRVVKVTSDWTKGVNHGALCVKGRFGYEFIHKDDRLKTPLIRTGNGFREATWDEALNLIAQKFSEVKRSGGPDAFAVFASAKVTNEENYLIQKFTRAVMGTNNVDHCARL